MQKLWNELNRQDFIEMNMTMTGAEIARIFGVTSGAVYYRFRMFGVNNSRKSRKFNPPREEIEALYKQKSMKEIAEHYSVSETAVFMYIKQLGIAPISRSFRLTGKKKSVEHRLSMSRSMLDREASKGEKNPNWKGGISSSAKLGRSKSEYFKWKNSVFATASWKCQLCSLEHGSICDCCGHRSLLHAHHIKAYSEYPELRYEISNGVALCEKCHKKVHYEKSGELLETPESQSTTAESK